MTSCSVMHSHVFLSGAVPSSRIVNGRLLERKMLCPARQLQVMIVIIYDRIQLAQLAQQCSAVNDHEWTQIDVVFQCVGFLCVSLINCLGS